MHWYYGGAAVGMLVVCLVLECVLVILDSGVYIQNAGHECICVL